MAAPEGIEMHYLAKLATRKMVLVGLHLEFTIIRTMLE